MSWIKPNFLWMMYRCGWASKEGQEVVLAVRLKRSSFDEILRRAVHSTYVSEVYESESAWKAAVGRSDVRLQWDPDHDLLGLPLNGEQSNLDYVARFWLSTPGNGSWASRMSVNSC